MLIIYSFFIFSFISQVREGYMCTIRSIFYEVINMNIDQSMILLILKDFKIFNDVVFLVYVLTKYKTHEEWHTADISLY